MIEYRDKPAKYLARLLAEIEEKNLGLRMMKEDGSCTVCLQEKLNIFSSFYELLYSST